MVDRIDISQIRSGDHIELDATHGIIHVMRKSEE
jgi:hypothetical protein